MAETLTGADARSFNWRCAFGLHRWAKWSSPTVHQMTATAQVVNGAWVAINPPHISHEWRQERACPVCGLTQRRKVTT